MADFQIYKPEIKLDWQPPETVPIPVTAGGTGLVVRAPNWLGDTVMTLPAVYQARRIMPDDQPLSVICPAALKPVWNAVEWVDQVIPIAGSRVDREADEEIRRLKPGVAVVLPNSFGSAFDVSRRGIPVRVGRSGRFRKLLLTHSAPKWKNSYRLSSVHQLSHYLEVISLLGEVESTPDLPALQPAIDRGRLDDLIPHEYQHRALILAPGAAYGPAKQWPVAYFHEVARWWNGRAGRVYVVGTESDRELAEGVLCGIYDGVNLCGKTDLNDLMGILQQARCCVANDSGVMHLASALGTDGVALFGSTNPRATGPLGPGRWIVLCDRDHCGGPCFARECPGRGDTPYGCLLNLRPATVCEAVSHLIEMEY